MGLSVENCQTVSTTAKIYPLHEVRELASYSVDACTCLPKYMYIRMFTEAMLMMVQNWKEHKCLPAGKSSKKTWYSPIIGNFPPVKKKKQKTTN